MCDYSLHSVASRPAKVGDKLTTRDFGTGTRGFAAAEDAWVAVCVLPGTELAFAKPVEYGPRGLLGWDRKTIDHRTAIFRQINKERVSAHHGRMIDRRERPSSIVRPQPESAFSLKWNRRRRPAGGPSGSRCRPRSGRRGPRARESMDKEEERAPYTADLLMPRVGFAPRSCWRSPAAA
jgi:hypothetical protein